MLRLAAIFVAVCMVLIAGALGVVCYLFFGLSGAESAVVGLAALTGLALYNTVSTRLRDRNDVGEQIAGPGVRCSRARSSAASPPPRTRWTAR